MQNDEVKNIQVILNGNPEIVFRIGIEAVRNNVNMIICIEDFCLAQNTILVKLMSLCLKEMKLNKTIKLENMLTDSEIIENSKNIDLTICMGNSNDYNFFSKKIKNIKFNNYNIFEVYADSEEFDEIKRKVYEYAMLNQYEIEIYDTDLTIEEAIDDINTNGYGYCSVLFSKDKVNAQKFKENINSKYIVINENPFNQGELEFNLKQIS